MKKILASLLVVSLSTATLSMSSAAQSLEMTPRQCDKPMASGPSLFVWDADNLALTKSRVMSGEASVKPAMKLLIETADKALTQGPYTVTAKTKTPPSGSKNDYYSIGPYWRLCQVKVMGAALVSLILTVWCELWTQLDYSLIASI